jgi:hypothetical protein
MGNTEKSVPMEVPVAVEITEDIKNAKAVKKPPLSPSAALIHTSPCETPLFASSFVKKLTAKSISPSIFIEGPAIPFMTDCQYSGWFFAEKLPIIKAVKTAITSALISYILKITKKTIQTNVKITSGRSAKRNEP